MKMKFAGLHWACPCNSKSESELAVCSYELQMLIVG